LTHTIREVAISEGEKYGWGLILIHRKKLAELLKALLEKKPDARILDVGAYKCLLYHWIDEIFPRKAYGWSYVGVDILGPFPEWEGKECYVMNAEALEFPPSSFDAALYIESIEHVPNYVNALREAYRVLRPGGLVFIQTTRCDTPNAIADETHFHVVHPVTMKRLLSWIGFTNIDYIDDPTMAIWGWK